MCESGEKFASPAESEENIQRPRKEKENTNSDKFFDVVSIKRGEIREVLIRSPISNGRASQLENVRS